MHVVEHVAGLATVAAVAHVGQGAALQQGLAGKHDIGALGLGHDLDAILDRRQGAVQPARACRREEKQ